MTRSQQPALTLFAVGMMGLGILALIYGDFALVWQPVAQWVPARTGLAYASGLVMLFGGIGLLFSASAAMSVRILLPYLVIWLMLKVPALVVAPQMEAVWLGFGEIAVLVEQMRNAFHRQLAGQLAAGVAAHAICHHEHVPALVPSLLRVC